MFPAAKLRFYGFFSEGEGEKERVGLDSLKIPCTTTSRLAHVQRHGSTFQQMLSGRMKRKKNRLGEKIWRGKVGWIVGSWTQGWIGNIEVDWIGFGKKRRKNGQDRTGQTRLEKKLDNDKEREKRQTAKSASGICGLAGIQSNPIHSNRLLRTNLFCCFCQRHRVTEGRTGPANIFHFLVFWR